jgi:succinate-semialdehyde dehydrogenase/glutarate-semialdehyde dehydrogenase
LSVLPFKPLSASTEGCRQQEIGGATKSMQKLHFECGSCVQPWNFPYYQLARFAAPNLIAGNVVMVKHAGCVPQCAIAFEKLWLDAGAPVGAYTNLLISHDQVSQVIDDPRIKGVALTGSVEAGRLVAARAGQNLKKSTMELGGSDAFIVLEDADLDQTVKWAVWAKMNNMGQCCIAAKRFIVVEELANRFLDKFQTALAALTPGDPLDETTTLGPLSTEAALVQLLDQVKRALAEGSDFGHGWQLVRVASIDAPA